MTPQLPLPLSCDSAYKFNQFIAAENAEVLTQLEHWCQLPKNGVIGVYGERGSGKSHLLQAAVNELPAGQAIYLPLGDYLSEGAAVVDGLATRIRAIVLDDLDRIGGNRDWEQAIFNLYNDLIAHQGQLLWSASGRPDSWGLGLDDLRSRLNASLIYQLRALEESNKEQALMAIARRRGLSIPAAVIHFIMRRQQRDMTTLAGLIERLDAYSLSHSRAITVPLVRELLASET